MIVDSRQMRDIQITCAVRDCSLVEFVDRHLYGEFAIVDSRQMRDI